MRIALATVAAALAGVSLSCASVRPQPVPSASAASGWVLELAGQFSLSPSTQFPPRTGRQIGGLSGLAPAGVPGEFFAVSDDRTEYRIYRIRVAGQGQSFRVDVLDTIELDTREDAPRLDPEAIVVTGTGDFLITSEGRGNQEPRVAPAIAQYSPRGTFVRRLVIRERFLPNERGASSRGVRENAGFESLTLAPGGNRLFSATETALVQDGDPATFERGTTARLLEYLRDGDTFVPGREFAYPVAAMGTIPFTAGTTAAGLVELLALSDDELLSLERTYIEVSGQRQGINHIRLYHVALAGATDVSAIDSLRDAGSVRPVRKTLVLDLSTLKGLAPELNTLDNFEGLAFGPPLSDGSRSLLIVSDDNFNRTQRTWFLQLRIAGR
jgi:3-phytase